MGLTVLDGDAWVVDGRHERALEYFRNALALKPNFARAQYAIVKAYIEMASTFKKYNQNVDEEMVKLRTMDAKLAEEAVKYRKSYPPSGLKGGPPPPAK